MRRTLATVASILLLAAAIWGSPQLGADSGYTAPPKVVVDILDTPPTPTVTVDPTRQYIALLERSSMPPISELAQPMLRLAGSRINPRTNGPYGGTFIRGITLKKIADGRDTKIALPEGARLSNVAFSPDGKRLSFTYTKENGIELWVADLATGQAKAVSGPDLNVTSGAPCEWLDDSVTLLCQFVVAGRGLPPSPPAVPTGPNIQENVGKAAPAPTYQDLLATAHDEDLFEHYFKSQLAFVDAATGSRTGIGRPGIYSTVSMSPKGEYLLVARLKRPFSRLVTAGGFPKDLEIWNRKGELVKKIADLPSSEGVPLNGVTTGPRSYRWHAVEPATVVWVEALDGGDLRNKVPHRDRVMFLKSPFGEPTELAKTEYRFQAIGWTGTGTAFLTEFDRTARIRMVRTWLVDAPGSARMLWERKAEDRYGDPGTPVTTVAGTERQILQVGDWVYLTGDGASPEGDRPFLDRLNLETLAKERLFQSDATSYETVVSLLTEDGKNLLTRYETKSGPPNFFVRQLGSSQRRTLTAFPDPAPQLAGVEKQMLFYERNDGVKLSATLYLPPGYRKGERLPVVVWAYPREFTDPDAASQVVGSPNRFTTYSGASHMFFLTQGYAVLDGPTMPIVGPGETANDTYVEQLVSSARAAVDTIVKMGIADPERIGVGGHSYGAFMTANLLAHSDIFRAGIARSGAYNRSLTPFGFQNERRTFWEVPEVYARMSPFWHAHKINEPILLVHGEVDNNSGTFPIQSERLYAALKGHGATVRYVTLPHESHGYAARESVLHCLAEMIGWFDKHVKNAKPRATTRP
jgi:dipeptidyl aminopeptidase/acylaminoacyl peptidase